MLIAVFVIIITVFVVLVGLLSKIDHMSSFIATQRTKNAMLWLKV